MPEISRFLGIIIKMYHDDHPPPHFHAYYQNFKASFDIRTGKKIEGQFPPKQSTLVMAWALLHERELLDNWNAMIAKKKAKKIHPLR